MPRKREWVFGDIVVTAAHVRLWMQTVGRRHGRTGYHHYVKLFDVPRRIADFMRRGEFWSTVEQEARNAGIKVRKIREPGTLTRIRKSWAKASNDDDFHSHGLECLAQDVTKN